MPSMKSLPSFRLQSVLHFRSPVRHFPYFCPRPTGRGGELPDHSRPAARPFTVRFPDAAVSFAPGAAMVAAGWSFRTLLATLPSQ